MDRLGPFVTAALLAEVVRKGWIHAPLAAAEAAPPRQPVTTWDELARDIEADREER